MKKCLSKLAGGFTFIQEWTQFLKPARWNWLTFNFACIEFDYDKIMGKHISFTFIILGLGFRFQWINEEMSKELDEIVTKFANVIKKEEANKKPKKK